MMAFVEEVTKCWTPQNGKTNQDNNQYKKPDGDESDTFTFPTFK